MAGWAKGDVLCLTALPHNVFYALPNWAEFCVVVVLAHRWLGWNLSTLLLCLFSVLTSEVALGSLSIYPNTEKHQPFMLRSLVSTMACLPAVSQDIARLLFKLSRGRLFQLFCHFDWMDGQGDHVAAVRMGLLVRNVIWCIFVLYFCTTATTWPPLLFLTAVVSLIMLVWSRSQRFDPAHHAVEIIRALKGALPLPDDADSGKSPTPFVVLAYQRTGSNLLCGILHNHPQVLMHNEVFNDVKIFSYLDCLSTDCSWKWNIFSRDRDPVGFVMALLRYRPLNSSFKLPQPRAVGFKVFPEHWTEANTSTLQQLLVDPRVKKVILHRGNYLDVYASKLRADKCGSYIGQKLDQIDIAINPQALQLFIEHYDACYALYDSLTVGQGPDSVLKLSYEDLDSDLEAEGQRLFAFLGADSLPRVRPLSVTVKQTLEPLCDHITNFAEVKFAFAHTKVARCFED